MKLPRASLRVTWVIFTKELLDTLRDRRTLFMMIGVPVLLYPALILLSLQVAVMQHEHLERNVTRVVVDSPWPELRLWLQERDKIKLTESEHPAAALDAGEVDVVVQTPNFDLSNYNEKRSTPIHLLYDATKYESLDGALRVEEVLTQMSDKLLEERLTSAGLDAEYIEPLRVEQVNVAPPEKTTGNILGMVLPMMMVMMIALGAFYPAVDLTAGEKERGTFETLLSTPASKMSILLGKFNAVAVLALATGLLNLGSMAATFAAMLAQVQPLFQGDFALEMRFPWLSVLWVVLTLIPFSGLISAVMMSIAVFARSFKEAQNYVTPFLLIIMAPAMFALLPGIELGAGTALVPVLNVVLLFRGLMTAEATLPLVLLVLASTTVFAGLAVGLAAWLFSREDVVLGDQAPPLFSRRAVSDAPRALTPGSVLALYGALAILLFYAGTAIQGLDQIGGVLIVQYGLLLLPTLAFLWLKRVDPREALSLRMPPPLAWPGALLLALGALVLLIQLGVMQNRYVPTPAGMEEFFNELFSQGTQNWGVLGVLFAIAISPAICEEILFRGVILSGLRQSIPRLAVVLLVGLMFGAFHMSLHRLLPTAIIGVLLTYTCLRTGSIFPGMLMHAIINGTSVLIATGALPEWVVRGLHLDSLEKLGLPLPVLMIALGLAFTGFALIEHVPRRKRFTLSRDSSAVPAGLV